ncbi:hypothetical protein ACVWZ4_006044 [Bradyrhizobium sp. USDA 4472]
MTRWGDKVPGFNRKALRDVGDEVTVANTLAIVAKTEKVRVRSFRQSKTESRTHVSGTFCHLSFGSLNEPGPDPPVEQVIGGSGV